MKQTTLLVILTVLSLFVGGWFRELNYVILGNSFLAIAVIMAFCSLIAYLDSGAEKMQRQWDNSGYL